MGARMNTVVSLVDLVFIACACYQNRLNNQAGTGCNSIPINNKCYCIVQKKQQVHTLRHAVAAFLSGGGLPASCAHCGHQTPVKHDPANDSHVSLWHCLDLALSVWANALHF